MSGALEGLRVIEFAQMFAGPGTGMYLADQGADVVKIEPPDGGRDRAEGEMTDTFLLLNRGKRSLAVDIRSEPGRAVVEALVRRSDVMLVAWPPGQAERLGYAYPRMRELNPRLVYASITGWGTRGPRARQAGYDRLQQAFTGLMYRNRRPDGTPATLPFFVADLALPMLLGYGIMLALWARERTGEGQQVEASQLVAQIAMQSIDLVFPEEADEAPDVVGKLSSKLTFRTRDGRYMTLVPLAPREWAGLWRATNLEAFAADPRLTTRTGRDAMADEIQAALAERFESATLEHWTRTLEEAGVPAAVVQTPQEFIHDEHVWENEMVTRVDHPVAGSRIVMNPPVRLSATPGAPGGPAPLLGEHSTAVLQDLGYDAAAIQSLLAQGVVVQGAPAGERSP